MAEKEYEVQSVPITEAEKDSRKRDSIFTVFKRRPTQTSTQSAYAGFYITKQRKGCGIHRPLFITRSMANDFGREAVFLASLREMFILIPFIATLILYSSSVFTPLMYQQGQTMYQDLVEKPFRTFGNISTMFADIRDITDIWHYLEGPLIDFLYNEVYYDRYDPIIPTEGANKDLGFCLWLLGNARIRQVRTRDDSCQLPSLMPVDFPNCYASYSEAAEDTASFGDGIGTQWVYSTAEETGHKPVVGYLETYGGGGYYQNLGKTTVDAAKRIESLKEHVWITRETRAVFVHITVYNTDLNVASVCVLLFELFPSGLVKASIQSRDFILIRTLKVSTLVKYSNYIIYGFIAYYIIEELVEMIHFGWKYFLQMWNYLELLIIIMSLRIIPYLINEEEDLPKIFEPLVSAEEDEEIYINLEDFRDDRVFLKDMLGLLIFFSIVKIVKYVNINNKMGQLNRTIHKCFGELAGFFLIFTMIIAAFADWAVVWFGDANPNYMSFGKSFFNTLRIVLGYFKVQMLSKENISIYHLYYVIFTITIFFLFLNMFIAIINKSYQDVSTEIAIAPEELQLTDYFKRLFLKCCKKLQSRAESERAVQQRMMEQLWLLLSKLGHSDIDIHLFFTRYNVKQEKQENLYDFEKLKAVIEKDTGMSAAMDKLIEAQEAQGKKDRHDAVKYVTASELATQSDDLEQIEQSLDGLVLKLKYFTSKLDLLHKTEED